MFKNAAASGVHSPSTLPAYALRAVLSLGLAAGLPAVVLTCWGWSDVAGFLAHPARGIAVAVLALRGALLPWLTKPSPRREAQPGKVVRERWFFLPLIAAALVSVASPAFEPRGWLTLPFGDMTRYAGLGLFVFGVFLASWAQWHMGRLFSGHLIIQAGHHLIMDGPFAWLRHPRYTGLMMVFAGWPLVFLSGLGLLAGLGCVALFLGRMPREEALLEREFQEEWRAYARRAKRVLPGLY